MDIEDEEFNEEDYEDPMPEILPYHFEEAVHNARRSVSDRDLVTYSTFARTLSRSSAAQTGSDGSPLANFTFPNTSTTYKERRMEDEMDEEEEEDLYS
jgi:transitional endoplasmic reticulum ATPase